MLFIYGGLGDSCRRMRFRDAPGLHQLAIGDTSDDPPQHSFLLHWQQYSLVVCSVEEPQLLQDLVWHNACLIQKHHEAPFIIKGNNLAKTVTHIVELEVKLNTWAHPDG